jgi:Zn-dependent protease with chaperone function
MRAAEAVFVPMVYMKSCLHWPTWAAVGLAFAFGILPANASDLPLSCSATTVETRPGAVSPVTLTDPGRETNPKNLRKYDVGRIGQRTIGKGLNLYSLEKERSLGARMAAAVDMETRSSTDVKAKDYLNRLGQKIVRNSDAQFPFTVKVLDSKNPTIFSLPGGFLYVDVTLLLDLDSEAELAGLMAHEIAHSVARHGTRLATRSFALNALLSFPIERMIGPLALPARQIGLAPLEKKFARGSEFEADLLGIEYQYAAGYDPQAYIEALEKLDNAEIKERARAKNLPKPGLFARLDQRLAHLYADYPPTELRIARLQTEISTLLPCRDNYVVDTDEFQEVKGQLLADQLVLHRRRPGSSNNGPVLLRHPSSD